MQASATASNLAVSVLLGVCFGFTMRSGAPDAHEAYAALFAPRMGVVANVGDAPALRSLSVTATAYNSLPSQTDDTPNIAAWGDRLEPGMRAIAVSRDLLDQGLRRDMRVHIEGLGDFVVLDKMNARYRRSVDIYMGEDIDAAMRFGRRSVRIRWREHMT